MALAETAILSERDIAQRVALLKELKSRREQLVRKLTCIPAVSIFGAVRSGQIHQLQTFLDLGAWRVDERDYNGCTPLHIAAHEGDVEICKVLIAYKADLMATDGKGRTPSDLAVHSHHFAVTRCLQRAANELGLLSSAIYHTLSPQGRQGLRSADSSTPMGSCVGSLPLSSGEIRDEDAAVDSAQLMAESIVGSKVLDLLQPKASAKSSRTKSADYDSSRDPQKLDEMGSPWASEIFTNYTTVSDTTSVFVCMVGLPGRGKSYISSHICRYMKWKGIPARVFNAGNYRRQILGAEETAGNKFFDPSNAEAVLLREQMAELACKDAVNFIRHHPVAIALLDATNTTRERRNKLVDYFRTAQPSARVLFIESVCDDKTIIHENILRAKCGNDDFKSVANPADVVAEFNERIKQYEKVYESMDPSSEAELSYIQIYNVKETVTIRNVTGSIPTRIAYFLLNLHPVAFPVYVACPGETMGQRQGILGGDDDLTPEGAFKAECLREFVLERREGSDQPLTVMYAQTPSCRAMVTRLTDIEGVELVPVQSLGDINYGVFAGLTHEAAKARFPKTYGRLYGSKNKIVPNAGHVLLCSDEQKGDEAISKPPRRRAYNTGYPRGESARQVNVRLEHTLLAALRCTTPLFVLCPEAPAQGFLAFVADLLPEEAPFVELPASSIVEVGRGRQVTIHNLEEYGVDLPPN